jgi:glycine cleavage system regulatory protein
MQIPLVMTIIGNDRTGLVESVARIVAEHDGNWLESRMCRLGGDFAGILRIHVPAARRAALEKTLAAIKDLSIVVRADEATTAGVTQQLATLEVFGQDRPGIVREFTGALASQGVNVEELATECTSAPMSGEPIFKATAKLSIPAGVPMGTLRQSLEKNLPGMTVEVSVRL